MTTFASIDPGTGVTSPWEAAGMMGTSCDIAILALVDAAGADGCWAAIQTRDVPAIFGTMMRLRALAEGAAMALAMEALTRGLVAESPHPSLTEWVVATADAGGAPVTAAVAAGFRRVSELARWRTPDLTSLVDATTAGRVPVATAARLGHDLKLIAAAVPEDIAATAIEAMTACAARGDSRQDLAIARQGVIATYGVRPSTDGPDDPQDADRSDGPDGTAAKNPFEADQEHLHVRRTLTSWRMAEDGMWERLWRTTNEGRAIADAALNALAAPHAPSCCAHGCGDETHTHAASDGTGGGDAGLDGASFGGCSGPNAANDPATERDLRTSGQRLHDALLDLCRVVASDPTLVNGEHVRPGAVAKTQLVITMPESDLRARTGYGTDGFGTIIPPEAVRRFACDAAVIPAVLGTDGAVLDLGRAARTASPAQFAALRIRDGGCTYPSCRAPASWCEAHHLTHWLDGGPTDLDNLALLCGAHHTHIHQRGWRGQLDPTGSVTWQPPPGPTEQR